MKEYRNWSLKVITKEQAEAEGNYYVFIYESGTFRRWDSYINHVLSSIGYVLSSGESHADLINSYYDSRYGFSVVEMVSLPIGITVFSSYNYEGFTLQIMERMAIDGHNNVVASEIIFDPSAGVPDFPQTRKRYYDSSVNPDYRLFDCYYNEDGSLNRIEYNSFHTDPFGQDGEDFVDNPESLQALMDLTGISQALMDYYVSPYVLPASQPV